MREKSLNADKTQGTGLITALDGPYRSLLMFPVLTSNDTLSHSPSQGGARHWALTRHYTAIIMLRETGH